jgi:hypothetical protein
MIVTALVAAGGQISLQEPVSANKIETTTRITCPFGEFTVAGPPLGESPTLRFGVAQGPSGHRTVHVITLPHRPKLFRIAGRCDLKYKYAVIDYWDLFSDGSGWRYSTVRVYLSPKAFVRAGPVNELDAGLFWKMFR